MSQKDHSILSLIQLNAIHIFSLEPIFFSTSLSLSPSSFTLFFFEAAYLSFDSAFDTMYRRKTRRQFLSLLFSLSFIYEDIV